MIEKYGDKKYLQLSFSYGCIRTVFQIYKMIDDIDYIVDIDHM